MRSEDRRVRCSHFLDWMRTGTLRSSSSIVWNWLRFKHRMEGHHRSRMNHGKSLSVFPCQTMDFTRSVQVQRQSIHWSIYPCWCFLLLVHTHYLLPTHPQSWNLWSNQPIHFAFTNSESLLCCNRVQSLNSAHCLKYVSTFHGTGHPWSAKNTLGLDASCPFQPLQISSIQHSDEDASWNSNDDPSSPPCTGSADCKQSSIPHHFSGTGKRCKGSFYQKGGDQEICARIQSYAFNHSHLSEALERRSAHPLPRKYSPALHHDRYSEVAWVSTAFHSSNRSQRSLQHQVHRC